MTPLPKSRQVLFTIKDGYVTDWEPVIRCKDCCGARMNEGEEA